jgi:hypothetical protein
MTGNSMMSEEASEAFEAVIVLRPEGIFDVPAAWRLREAIATYAPTSNVTLDFGGLRECHDFALAALLQSVASTAGPRLSIRGLCRHQERLLRYLGVDASVGGQATSLRAHPTHVC